MPGSSGRNDQSPNFAPLVQASHDGSGARTASPVPVVSETAPLSSPADSHTPNRAVGLARPVASPPLPSQPPRPDSNSRGLNGSSEHGHDRQSGAEPMAVKDNAKPAAIAKPVSG